MLLVSEPILGAEEKEALAAVIESGWVTMGDRVQEFEQAFARLHEAEDSIAVSACTSALHLILHGLGIGPGDEVLVPSLTFVATANSVLYVGARPVFVDIESPEVPLMSLDEAEAKCTERTKAVIIMHFGGYLGHRDGWQSFARRKGLLLIEEAAHAPTLPVGNGAIHESMAIGASSDAGCASHRNQAADRRRSPAQARYSNHRSLSSCTSPDVLQRPLPGFSFAANRGICPTGAHATSPSPDDPGHRRTRREFSCSRAASGPPGGGNRMTLRDAADQLS